MENVTRSELEVPFRSQDLLTLSSFIGYCSDRGIRTSPEQLEFYDKMNLLIPAVRVDPGYGEMRRILATFEGQEEWRFVFEDDLPKFQYKELDKKIYYSEGAFSMGTHDWLDFYKERDMIIYPARIPFHEWKEYDRQDFEDQVSHPYTKPPIRKEAFYSKYQIFALRDIQNKLAITVRDEVLFSSDEDWKVRGKKIRELFELAPDFLRKNSKKYLRIILLLNAILDLREGLTEEANETFYQSVSEHKVSNREAVQDAIAHIDLQERNYIPTKATDLIRSLKFSSTEISDIREDFIFKGYWLDQSVRWFEYMELVPTSKLERARGDYKLALECYDVAHRFEWLLTMLGEHPKPLKEVLTAKTGIGDYRLCPYCRDFFKIKGKGIRQTSCGKPDCVRKNRNSGKRLRRKSGLIK